MICIYVKGWMSVINNYSNQIFKLSFQSSIGSGMITLVSVGLYQDQNFC